ncbi:epidermal growth factor receptor kinase substrate 8-like protein 3 [Leuresthes tenuis]|uniref:epidermal growth factor receptor kinase substrate 8-like protein 3 n=1 Tax=Leuresthes tenuis TaxID=355514 RepID=UPI003B505A82
MFRDNSPFGSDSRSYAESIHSNGYSTMDETSSQISNLSKPSAKSIYLQRRQYATSMNKMMGKFQYRVEHLFTCDLDGKELRNVQDCVERLQLLDQMGRVWAQNMQLEARGVNLLFTDIESKEELESISLSDILELKAILDSEGYNSLLTVSVQSRRKHITTVYLFQCEDVRADYVQKDLSRALSHSNGRVTGGHDRVAALRDTGVPQSIPSDYGEDDYPEPELHLLQDEDEEEMPHEMLLPNVVPSPQPPSPRRPYTEFDRNVDMFNHILNDIEIFMAQIAAVVAKNAKKKKKKKKGKVLEGMPPAEEFAGCLHKIKSGLNLLGELKGKLHNPSDPEFVHSLFSALAYVVSHCPEGMPPTIVAPLLSPQCIRFLSEEASAEEDELWQSLGDAWNIPSTQWPEDDEDVPTYTLTFYDGWQPPEISATPAQSEPGSRRESPQPAPSPQYSRPTTLPTQSFGTNGQTSNEWKPAPLPQKSRSRKEKICEMRVKYDFFARNQRELTIRKGEMVELLDKSKQWWKVRNSRGEEGYVPNNVLEANDGQPDEPIEVSPVLTRRSKPAEVKAWLEDKGFSQITVRCLGGLSGSMLLGMSREELKMVCPEEGGRVFFQLQAVKSTFTGAS